MSKKSLTLFLVTAIMSFWALAATASTGPRAIPPKNLVERGYVLPPFRFSEFCVRYPLECQSAGGAAQVHMTKSRMAALEAVNRRVNRAITPTADPVLTRSWALNVSQGDCNEYAVQKRHELLRQGWPPGVLALAVVRTGWGEGHLVLTVRTDRGDLVLDNLRPVILDWRMSGYAWIMRQSNRNPRFWVALNSDSEDDAGHGQLARMMFADRGQSSNMVASIGDKDVSVVAAAFSEPSKPGGSGVYRQDSNGFAPATASVGGASSRAPILGAFFKTVTSVSPWRRPSWSGAPFRQARQGLAIRPYIRQVRRQPSWFVNARRLVPV